MTSRHGARSTTRALVAAAICWSTLVIVTAGATGIAAAQDPSPATTDAPVTTSTLPESNEQFGRIIPSPNSGAEPQSPGDRGGWQQITLFLVICATIVAMAVAVWLRSRRLRAQRRAAGHDRVTQARLHGGDVRKPRPPGIVD